MKLNYFLIPVFVLIVALTGSYFTNTGMNQWYKTIKLPSLPPPGSIIGAVWTTLFI